MGFLFFNNKQKPLGEVSILIPTMNDSRYIIELCLKSIQKNTNYKDYKIIVCDAGVDQETYNYLHNLAANGEINLIRATDNQRPKDDLAKAVNTDYYVIMHDDIQIRKKDWLTRRMQLMVRSKNNAIVGTIVHNFGRKANRFFPLGLLVKTDIARKLDLKWGKQDGFDTGTLAYNKFFSQNEYKFVNYNVARDIYHFMSMGWPKRKLGEKGMYPELEMILNDRNKKIIRIRKILETNSY